VNFEEGLARTIEWYKTEWASLYGQPLG